MVQHLNVNQWRNSTSIIKWFSALENEIYDRAEICELVGIYLLSCFSTIIDKNDCGFYRQWFTGLE